MALVGRIYTGYTNNVNTSTIPNKSNNKYQVGLNNQTTEKATEKALAVFEKIK